MRRSNETPIRVIRIIARMNIGGPAVQVSGLMRGFKSQEFDHRLYISFCATDEGDNLEIVANDVKAKRIEGLRWWVSLGRDVKSFVSIVNEIRSFKPHILHTHTSKAGFLGRIASIVSLQSSLGVHTFYRHLLNGYFGLVKRRLVITAEQALAVFTHQLLAVGNKFHQDLLFESIGKISKFGLMPPGLEIGQLPDKVEAKEFYGLSSITLQCTFIGRVTQIKHPDRFLDVMRELKNRGVKIDFFIAGGGELLDACRERIVREQLSVQVLGWQSNIEKILAAANVVVLTSDNEGMPLSLI